MASAFPAEAENIVSKLLFGKTPNYELGTPGVYKLGLIANIANGLSNTTTLSDISELQVSGNPGYASINTTSDNWVVTAGTSTYPPQLFTAGGGGWVTPVKGYFVATIPTNGASAKLLFVQEDGPYIFTAASTYEVTLNIALT